MDTTKELAPISRRQQVPAVITTTIIFHPDTARIGDWLSLPELHSGQSVAINRNHPQFICNSKNARSTVLPLSDPYLSRQALTISIVGDSLAFSLPHYKRIVRINGERLSEPTQIPLQQLTEGVCIALANRAVLLMHWGDGKRGDGKNDEINNLSNSTPLTKPFTKTGANLGFIGQSLSTRHLRKQLKHYSANNACVLIRGETGTGKELAARALHALSPRADKPLISVNMGAIPQSLASSELFGNHKGAFTGADAKRQGYVGQANGSSLFMDEIGEISGDIQSHLLRALDAQEIQPVGGGTQKIDVRFIAATDADLEQRVANQQFSYALLQRLSALTIQLPPLRQRREDIGLLLVHFISAECARAQNNDPLVSALQNPELCQSLALFFEMACLQQWPGNIRQLQHWARRSLLDNSNTDCWQIPNVETHLRDTKNSSDESRDTTKNRGKNNKRKPRDIGDDELQTALRKNQWDISAAAKDLAVSRSALYKLIDASPIVRRASDVNADEIQSQWDACNGDIKLMVSALKISEGAIKRRLRELAT